MAEKSELCGKLNALVWLLQILCTSEMRGRLSRSTSHFMWKSQSCEQWTTQREQFRVQGTQHADLYHGSGGCDSNLLTVKKREKRWITRPAYCVSRYLQRIVLAGALLPEIRFFWWWLVLKRLLSKVLRCSVHPVNARVVVDHTRIKIRSTAQTRCLSE